ncbi:MAG TPA: hypothetical protein DCO79_09115 [Spirochaeta sp.]|nr:hypothetical protein [Spirochaeta sp.]
MNWMNREGSSVSVEAGGHYCYIVLMFQHRDFPYIPIKIPRYKILKRLGYHSRKIEVTGRIMEEVDELIEQAAGLIELKAAALRCSIEAVEGKDKGTAGFVAIGDEAVRFESNKLCGFLSDSSEALIMGITCGPAVTEEIKRLQHEKQMTAAVVIDAAASEIVDDGFDWIAALYAKELVRESRKLTARRFSAGYGDFDIRFQTDIHSMLNLEKLGVEITESSMLLPEKSVTAIYGIM